MGAIGTVLLTLLVVGLIGFVGYHLLPESVRENLRAAFRAEKPQPSVPATPSVSPVTPQPPAQPQPPRSDLPIEPISEPPAEAAPIPPPPAVPAEPTAPAGESVTIKPAQDSPNPAPAANPAVEIVSPTPGSPTPAADAQPATPGNTPPAATGATAPPKPAEKPSLLPEMKSPDGEPAAAAAPEAAPSSAEGERAEMVLTEPLETLRNFFKAKTWRERYGLSLPSDSLRKDMEAYYRGGGDGPISPTSITFTTSQPAADAKYSIFLFHVTFPDIPEGFPVSVEQTADGNRVDWRPFAEFKDRALKRFFAKYTETPGVFRVKFERTHYFDKDVPNLEQKYCFRVSAPIFGDDGFAFVDRDDQTVAPKLGDYLTWQLTHYVSAKLKWVKDSRGRQHVELVDIVAPSWRTEIVPARGPRTKGE